MFISNYPDMLLSLLVISILKQQLVVKYIILTTISRYK